MPRDSQTLKSDALLRLATEYADTVATLATERGAKAPSGPETDRGLDLADRPVFVCGLPRSGTTLVQGLLNSSDELLVLPSEGSYLTSLVHRIRGLDENQATGVVVREWVTRLVNINGGGPHWLLGRSTADSLPYVEFARRVAGWVAVLAGTAALDRDFRLHAAVMLAFWSASGSKPAARYWVDKTPGNERHMRRILRGYPRATFIHVLRDPRAIVASRLRLQRRFGLGDGNRRQILRQLRRSFRCAVKNAGAGRSGRYCITRYETLVSSPQTAMQDIVAALRLQLSPMQYRPVLHGGHYVANSSFAEPEVEQRAVYGSSVDRFESYLTAAERVAVSASVGPLARRFNYCLEPVPIVYRLKYRATDVLLAALGRVRRFARHNGSADASRRNRPENR